MANDSHERCAFLMVDYETPDLVKEIQNSIKKDDLYTEDDNEYGYEYGLEKDTHVTLVACLDNDVDLKSLKKCLKPLSEYDVVLKDISVFENDDFDVLKCSVISKTLLDSNEEIRNKFETHSNFETFKPHLTIAYMKKGKADKYKKDMLDKLIYLKSKNFSFSFYKDDKPKEVKFEK